jgi:hypothetical protein
LGTVQIVPAQDVNTNAPGSPDLGLLQAVLTQQAVLTAAAASGEIAQAQLASSRAGTPGPLSPVVQANQVAAMDSSLQQGYALGVNTNGLPGIMIPQPVSSGQGQYPHLVGVLQQGQPIVLETRGLSVSPLSPNVHPSPAVVGQYLVIDGQGQPTGLSRAQHMAIIEDEHLNHYRLQQAVAGKQAILSANKHSYPHLDLINYPQQPIKR